MTAGGLQAGDGDGRPRPRARRAPWGAPTWPPTTLLTLGTAAFYQRPAVAGPRPGRGGAQDRRGGGAHRDPVPRARDAALDHRPRRPARRRSPTEREGIALARRAGNRASEINIIFNAVEDARRTGDWDWAVSRARRPSAQLDIDESSLVGNRAQQVFFEVYRGTFDAAELRRRCDRRTEVLEDRDLAVRARSRSTAPSRMPPATGPPRRKAWMAVARCQRPQRARTACRGPAARRSSRATRPRRRRPSTASPRSARRGGRWTPTAPRSAPGIAALDGDRAARATGYRVGAHRVPRPRAALGRGAGRAWRPPSRLGDGDAELAGWTDDVAGDLHPARRRAAARPARRERSSTATRPSATGAVVDARAGGRRGRGVGGRVRDRSARAEP